LLGQIPMITHPPLPGHPFDKVDVANAWSCGGDPSASGRSLRVHAPKRVHPFAEKGLISNVGPTTFEWRADRKSLNGIRVFFIPGHAERTRYSGPKSG
jgi:hypothetical protein